uniref:Rho termination factor N-terminal domain-containing protein n=1 Tax=viral metagenome TaxID=1070528 RepID=A0A6C0IFM1_9ZZZZ
MSFISESLTIGLLLAIVFGALFFYLYTRVTYNEKRVSLMENILLDIKMNQEQQPLHILPPIPHDVSFHQTLLQQQQQQEDDEEDEETPFEVVENEVSEEVVADEEEYTELLNQVHDEVKEEVLPVITNITIVPTNKYDSMTKDELVELVKKRGLRAGNRPGREKLISILEKSDESTVSIEGGSFNDLQEAVSE